MAQNGKGSKPRPLSVDSDTFGANWERIFGCKHEYVWAEGSKSPAECRYCGEPMETVSVPKED